MSATTISFAKMVGDMADEPFRNLFSEHPLTRTTKVRIRRETRIVRRLGKALEPGAAGCVDV